MDTKTRHAIKHTVHCLIGCGLGEIAGMLIGAGLGWHRGGRVLAAIALAFAFGYTLTYIGVRRQVKTAAEAVRVTLTTDTVSIVSMELVDTVIELIIPNALVVTATSPRFWWGLGLALAVAFVITVPVNRALMVHSDHH